MKKIIPFTTGFITAILVVLFATSSFAAGLLTQINVDFSPITILINGKTLNPTDANGNPVQPFIYNGTTYLPVRAVSNAFGKEVNWDGNTRTVIINDPKVELPQVTYFEDSFVNKPLDEKWSRRGIWTFDGVNGLECEPSANGALQLKDVVEYCDKYTIQFDALASPRITKYGYSSLLFCFSPGYRDEKDDDNGSQYFANTISVFVDGVYLQDGSSCAYSASRKEKVSSLDLQTDTFYNVNIEVDNKLKQVNIYIDNKLISSVKTTKIEKPAFAFFACEPDSGWSGNHNSYYLRNFTLTVND